jgi:hypothetical protein
MIVQISIGSAAVAIAVGIGLMHHLRQQECRRRERHLLIEGLHQASIERRPVLRCPPASTRQSEMEELLDVVGKAAAALAQALAVEEQLGAKLYAAGTTSPSLFEQWRVSRSSVERAQQEYHKTVEQYREFVHSLAPPLRSKAAARGCVAMTLARA